MAVAKILAFCVALCVIRCEATSNISKIFMIDDELYAYVFSCASNQLIALSADQKSLLFYDISKQSPPRFSVTLPLPGELLQVSADGKHIAITHDSYLSVIHRDGTYLVTRPVPVVEASSIVIIEEFVCLVPSFDQWTQITCLNMDSGSVCTCKEQVYAGGLAFTNAAQNWVYLVDQGLDPQSMHKFNVSGKPRCLNYIHDNSDFGTYYYGEHLWYSFDGSRIFLESGLTLTSSDDLSDMKPHGDFNSSYETYQYSYFSQSSTLPNNVVGIRSDTNHIITFYNWPYLNPIDSEPIFVPPRGRVSGAEQVHVCDQTTPTKTHAIVKFAFAGNTTKTGVVAFG